MDIAKQVETFKTLPNETQKEKVLAMLKTLQWTNEIFSSFYKTLNLIHDVSSNVLIYIYQSILEIAEALQQGDKQKAQDKIKKIWEALMSIRRAEELDNEREGSADKILQNI